MNSISMRKTMPALFLSMLIAATASAAPWKFGVISDTQWPNSPDNKNPNVAVNVIRHVDQQFIDQGVKFVVQVGDLTDGGSNPQLDIRATFAQDLYNAGIGFFPLRGNHESSKAGALEVQRIFPQTGAIPANAGVNNQTPADAMNSTTIYGPQANTNTTFTIGSNFVSEPGLEGLTYSFDYDNARFILLDQFTLPSGTAHSNLTSTDVNWVGTMLSTKPATNHGFVFAHKHLMSENHADTIFGTNPGTASTFPLQNQYMSYLANYGVHYHIGGHDHMHNRAIVTSPDGLYKVQNLVTASDSYKFYIPAALQAWQSRETQIAQELFAIGYYIFTVDGPKVTVDYYASPNGCNGDCDETNDLVPYDFSKHETFGYSLNGKEVVVPQGGSYVLADNTAKAVTNGETGYLGTTATILNGINGSTGKDYDGRALAKTVDTGWSPAVAGHASDIITFWGMANSLATNLSDLNNANQHYKYVVPNTSRTDTYALSLSYNDAILKGGVFALAVKDQDGNWVRAINGNDDSSVATLVNGPYSATYPLGAYGIDPATKTAWAVVNHSSDFAVAPLSVSDISAQISATASGFVYNRASKLYTGVVTITNTGAAITGPVAVALSGLPSGVTLANAMGQYNGAPYTTTTNSGLDAGASIKISLSFSNPTNAKINFTPVTFQE